MRNFSLIACLMGFPLSALAAEPVALQPGLAYVAEPLGREGGDVVILMAVGPEGRVGGDVLSSEGDVLCPEAWGAELGSDPANLRFSEIAINAACAAQDELQDLAERLARVASGTVTENGSMLLDASGIPLLRLVVAG